MALEGCDATPGKKNSPALPNLLCDMPICTSRYGNSNWLSIEMAVWNCGTVSRRWFHAWNVLKERRSRVSVRHRGEDSRAQIARYCYSFGIYHIQSASAGVICIWKTTLLTLLSSSRHARANNRWNYGTIYIFLYVCVCVCMCVFECVQFSIHTNNDWETFYIMHWLFGDIEFRGNAGRFFSGCWPILFGASSFDERKLRPFMVQIKTNQMVIVKPASRRNSASVK